MELNHSGKGLVVRTPAKLNLFLDVGKLREDGYHPIDSIFQAVSFYDELEFIPIPGEGIELVEEGIAAGKKNIVYQAAEGLLQEVGGAFPSGVRIPRPRPSSVCENCSGSRLTRNACWSSARSSDPMCPSSSAEARPGAGGGARL